MPIGHRWVIGRIIGSNKKIKKYIKNLRNHKINM